MFETELHTKPFGNRSKLLQNLTFRSAKYRVVVTVPAGFVTDFASIPRLARLAIPVMGKHRAAAAVHDFMYFKKNHKRNVCDGIFLEAMKESGVAYWKRWVMYLAVRSGGWVFWRGESDGRSG